MLNEVMIENDEEIVLDSTNNVFVGPNEYFKVVIDDFDGTTVKAWHFEDSKGNKSENLADRAQGKHIDAMIDFGSKSVTHFVDRYQINIMKYQQKKIAQLTAKVNAPAPTPAPAPAPAPAPTPPPAPAPAESSGVPVAVPVVIAIAAVVIIALQAKKNKGA